MPQLKRAFAIPRKRFFVEMFTRDISLKDCILDLVDNSIDGLIRSRNINLVEDFLNINPPDANSDLPQIVVKFSSKNLSVTDNCGGISLKEAQQETFNFGHSVEYYNEEKERGLGVYGVGLKRALFKIGRSFEVISKTTQDGFRVKEDNLEEWIKKDESIEDWSFEMEESKKADSVEKAGTRVIVSRIRGEVRNLLEDARFVDELRRDVARVYTFFLDRFVRVEINGVEVRPQDVPIGQSDDVAPAVEQFNVQNVKVVLLASLAARDQKGRWTADQAGWYIACNGRMVTTADRTTITGWGTGSLPSFVPKYRGFVGLGFFESANPLLLPWKTTKRDLNDESPVYQIAKAKMGAVSRSVLSFLDKMYASEEQEHDDQRQIADRVTQAPVSRIKQKDNQPFKILHEPPVKKTTSVQYSVNKTDIQLIRKHIRRPSWSNSKIGKFTFDYYLESEDLK